MFVPDSGTVYFEVGLCVKASIANESDVARTSKVKLDLQVLFGGVLSISPS